MMDLMKMPRSSPVSRALLPFRLIPRPADPESLRGTSNIICSFPSSHNNGRDTSSFCRRERERERGREREREREGGRGRERERERRRERESTNIGGRGGSVSADRY